MLVWNQVWTKLSTREARPIQLGCEQARYLHLRDQSMAEDLE
jgi:hypothetical protein